tara:strand:- start:12115 stop:13605 length:1491 start_codon:yes stop_codon:yes gene_type:complete
MAFDDILESKFSRNKERPVFSSKPKPAPSAPKPPIESLLGDVDVSQFAKRLGLNDDLTKQVLVPLLAILDKHGGKVIDPESPTTQTLVSLSTMANEFGPLIQGAYQYFSGVKTQLDAADAALLEANAAALSASELNTLFGSEDDVETTIQEEEVVKTSQGRPESFGPDGGPNHAAPKSLLELGKIDYYSLLANDNITSQGVKGGGSDIYSQQQDRLEMATQATTGWEKLPPKASTIVPVNALASENGMSSEEVKTADNQHSVNGGKPNEKAINLMSPKSAQVVDEGRSDILSAMRQETQTRKMWSSDPAQANPTMSPTELVAHIKAEANPGQGGQTSTDAYRMRRTTRGFDVVVGAKDAFNIAGAEDLAANAFNVAGLSEAMEVEKASHRASQNITSTSTSTGLGADSSFMNELVASQTEELTAMEAESSIVTGVSNEDWTIGSINDLSNEDVGIQGIELEIPELDVSLSDNSATVDADAVDRTPKRNQFRSSNSS